MGHVFLALDSAGHACSLALVQDDASTVEFAETLACTRGHAAVLSQLGARAFARVDPQRVCGVILTQGPGGFTGMRAGLAYAQGFALARELPIWGLDSFAALRLTVGDAAPCLIDTRRGDFFIDAPTAQHLAQPDQNIIPSDQAPPEGDGVFGSIWLTATGQSWAARPPALSGGMEPCPVAMAAEGWRLKRANTPPSNADGAPLVPHYIRDPALG